MAEKVSLFNDPLIIKYKGIYDYEGFYRLIRAFFKKRGYVFFEPKYKDKVGGPFGNEIELKLEGEKKVTEFVKFYIKLETWHVEMKEFDAKVDDHYKKLTNGRMSVSFKEVAVEFDWQDKFKTDFQKKLLKWLVFKILKRYYEIKYMGPLEGEAYSLHEEIKKHLALTEAQ